MPAATTEPGHVLTDEQLAAGSRQCPENFDILVRRYERKLRGFIFNSARISQADIEDIVQESFLRAYTSLASFDLEQKWKPWLFQIALNTCYSFLRRPKPENIDDFSTLLSQPSTLEGNAESQLQAVKIKKALALLPAAESRLLHMHFYSGLAVPEISGLYGIPQSKVRVRLNLACVMLKSIYFSL